MWGNISRPSHTAICCICLILYGCGLIASCINFGGSLRHIYGGGVRPQKTRLKIILISSLPASSPCRNYHLRGGHESPLSSPSPHTHYRHHHHFSNTTRNLRYKVSPRVSRQGAAAGSHHRTLDRIFVIYLYTDTDAPPLASRRVTSARRDGGCWSSVLMERLWPALTARKSLLPPGNYNTSVVG